MAKVAIITGSSSGIGRSVAEYFASKGCKVVIAGRNKEKLDEVERICNEKAGIPDNILQVISDITSEDDRQHLVNETVKHFGKIDILVNNAGVLCAASATSGTLEVFDQQFDPNVRGLIRITQLCIPHLKETKGAIVSVSSVCSQLALNTATFYSMTKAALDMYTKCLALEMAPFGVRVNTVNPAIIRTNIFESSGMPAEEVEKMYAASAKSYPLGRVGSGEDIAKGIWFLASEDSSFITGQKLNFCGGVSVPTLVALNDRQDEVFHR